jgi:2-amino-4-hydroxy-6-hydroxymethyldihydropteridine diphosphokinase
LTLVYLGLGSNLGDREANLQSALQELNSPDLRLLRTSRIYETEPVGFLDQPLFLNLAAEFETSLSPRDLLQRTQDAERILGRIRTIKNGPRTLDIDILLFGDAVHEQEGLTIPHPRYRERRFTLEPLAELNPELRDPHNGQTMATLLAALGERE